MTRWYGKLLGFIAGWLLTRHPLGGLAGLLLGHAFDADWLGGARGRDTRRDATQGAGARDDDAGQAPAATQATEAPHTVLGVREDASDTEIDQAYRRMIGQYHPDRMMGLPEDLRRHAEARASAINTAYDRLQALRRGR